MANTLDQLRSSVLSAENIKELSGWPDELVLDYLTIIQDLILLATQTDSSDSTITQLLASIGGISKNKASLQKQKKTIRDLQQLLFSELGKIAKVKNSVLTMGKDLETARQEALALQGLIQKNLLRIKTLDAKVGTNNQTYFNSFGALSFACRFTGAGASNPTVNQSFNVATLLRLGVGSYRLSFNDSTPQGQNIENSYIFEAQNFGATTADTNYQLQYVFGVGTIVVNTFQITGAAAAAYDLTASDSLHIGGLLYAGN